MEFLSKKEIERCYSFAEEVVKLHSQKEGDFGTKEKRNAPTMMADLILGKMAEIIFKKEYESKIPNSRVELDFNHYLDPNHLDDGDVKIYIDNQLFPIRIDIKSSTSKSRWLLVESYKLFDNNKKFLSDRYVFVRFNDTVPGNPQLRKDPYKILNEYDKHIPSGKIVGWAIGEDFISSADKKGFFEFKKDQRLLNVDLIPKVKFPAAPYDRSRIVQPLESEEIITTEYLKYHVIKNYREKVISKYEKEKSRNPYIDSLEEYHKKEKEKILHVGPTMKASLNYGLPDNWLRPAAYLNFDKKNPLN